MGSPWITPMEPKSKDMGPFKRKAEGDFADRRGEGHVARDAEAGGTQPRAQGRQEHQGLEESGRTLPGRQQWEHGPADPLVWDFFSRIENLFLQL